MRSHNIRLNRKRQKCGRCGPARSGKERGEGLNGLAHHLTRDLLLIGRGAMMQYKRGHLYRHRQQWIGSVKQRLQTTIKAGLKERDWLG